MYVKIFLSSRVEELIILEVTEIRIYVRECLQSMLEMLGRHGWKHIA